MPWIKLPDGHYFLKHYLCVYQWMQGYYQRRMAWVGLKVPPLSPKEAPIPILKQAEALTKEVLAPPKSMRPPGKSYTPYYDMQRHQNKD